MTRVAAILLFLLLLLPSAWFAWNNRAMPQLGRAHDDAIYYTVAKSVAQGTGYRILNLPEMPYETKYPPVLIWLLSICWLINPKFPDNLVIATVFQWAIIPLFLWLCWIWLRRAGMSNTWSWIGLSILAFSPYTVLFSAGIFTEVLFSAFVLLSLLFANAAREKEKSLQWAAVAGLLAGAAYLTRTAGIVAAISTPVVFLLWGKRKEALAYIAGIIPTIAGWAIWVHLHRTPAKDLVAIYNTDYLGFFLTDIHFHDLGLVIWTNLDYFLYAIGALVFPYESGAFFWHLIRVTAAIGIFCGLARYWKMPLLQLYLAFALLTSAELIVWDFPPNLRLAYQLVPLFLAGLLWETQHFIDMLRRCLHHRDRSQRVAAWSLGVIAAGIAVASIYLTGDATFRNLPAVIRDNEVVQEETLASFHWIAEHSSPETKILSRNPVLYLYTGRHTESLFFLPIHWYRQDSEPLTELQGLSGYASQRHLDLIYLHDSDFDSIAGGAKVGRPAVESSAGLRTAFQRGRGTVYQLVPDHTLQTQFRREK